MQNVNMTEKRHTMPARDPSERCSNFCEVMLGYDEETAISEARRCLNCKARPCMEGCPVGVMIPDFLALVAEGKFEEAYEVVRRTNALPAVSGRVCPQETQCEGRCVRGKRGDPVGIGYIERFIADRHMQKNDCIPRKTISNGHKVAVVGSGPAGLSCAGELAELGYEVTVFEALHLAGGVLVYGIPEFRLPKEIVRRETEELRACGVEIVTNAVVGRSFSVEELMKEYGFEAVFLGTGAGLPRFMGIPGENARGVFSANEYLTRINLMKAYEEGAETPLFPARKVAVVGGGNVAMDAARCARRMGAEVTVVYRRSAAELPARREEVVHAEEEGVRFRFLCNPTEVLTDGENAAIGLCCVEMTLGEPDASGRRRPKPKTGSEFTLEADCVIMALGTSPNPLLGRTTDGLQTGPHGEIGADGAGRTSLEGVFAGGDAVTGSATVILAMGAGRRAAKAIDEYIRRQACHSEPRRGE